jgi:hypothetical protein
LILRGSFGERRDRYRKVEFLCWLVRTTFDVIDGTTFENPLSPFATFQAGFFPQAGDMVLGGWE